MPSKSSAWTMGKACSATVMVTEKNAEAVITPPAASPPLTRFSAVASQPVLAVLPATSSVAGPGRRGVVEHRADHGVLLLLARQARCDGHDQTGESGGRRIGRVDELRAQTPGAVFPPGLTTPVCPRPVVRPDRTRYRAPGCTASRGWAASAARCRRTLAVSR